MKDKNIPCDLSIIFFWSILTLIFIFIPILNQSFIRSILGIPTVLFIPGYVSIRALFPKKDDLEIIERISLSFALSIVVVSLSGMVLNFTFGIMLIPIIIALCTYIIVLGFISEYRMMMTDENERFTINLDILSYFINAERRCQDRPSKILTIILIFSIIIAIGMLVYVITIPKIGERFTEFYILNSSSEKADVYPNNLKFNSPTNILVGVSNHEYSVVNYTVKINLDKNILNSEQLNLNNNETWQKNITILPNKIGKDMRLEFLLYKENNFTIPYRELHLWINII